MHRCVKTAVAAVALSVLTVACGAPQAQETTGASQAARAPSGEPGGATEAAASASPSASSSSTTPAAAETPPADIVTTTTMSDPGPACTPTAATSTGTIETGRFTVGAAPAPQPKTPVVVLRDLQMCAGQPHLFVGGHAATVSTPMSWGVDVLCTRQGDAETPPEQQGRRRSTLSTRAHDGDGTQELAVRWLFTPDVSGTYDCALRSWGRVPSGSGTMQVVPDEDTVLRVSDVQPFGVEWRQEADAYLCNDQPDDPGCARSAELLRREVTAAGGTTSLEVYAGIEASVCTTGYERCSPGTAGEGWFTVRTRLIATQVTGPGSRTMCDGAQAHIRDLTIQVPGDGELDHTKIHSEIEDPVPVVRGGNCSSTFVVRVIADYQRTNPETPNHGGVIEGAIPDDPSDPDGVNRAYTSAYVLQNR